MLNLRAREKLPASSIGVYVKVCKKYHLFDFNNLSLSLSESTVPSNRQIRVFFPQNASLFHMHRNIRTTVSRTMKLHFRKSNRGPGASSQLHCLYEYANNGTTHFLREYILTISNRSRTCRQANTRGPTDMCGSTCIKSTNSKRFFPHWFGALTKRHLYIPLQLGKKKFMRDFYILIFFFLKTLDNNSPIFFSQLDIFFYILSESFY